MLKSRSFHPAGNLLLLCSESNFSSYKTVVKVKKLKDCTLRNPVSTAVDIVHLKLLLNIYFDAKIITK